MSSTTTVLRRSVFTPRILTGALICAFVCVPASPATGLRGAVSHRRLKPAQPVAVSSAADVFGISPSQSSFIIHAYVGGLFSALGHNHTIAVRDFTGGARLDPNNLGSSWLEMKVKSASLTVIDKIKQSDKEQIENTMRTEVLDTAKYPDIYFKSSGVSVTGGNGNYQARITGNLSLHGAIRQISINAQVRVDGNTLRAHGEFPLKQTEYNIKPVSVAGGTIKVKDDLKVTFDIVANK